MELPHLAKDPQIPESCYIDPSARINGDVVMGEPVGRMIRRAKVINAEGEYQAAAKMAEAARVLATEPISVQLRYLQTLREIAAEKNSTTLFPIPIDLIKPFLKLGEKIVELEDKKD